MLCTENKGGSSGCSVVKNRPANAGDSGVIPGSEDPLEKGSGSSLQYPFLGNPIDREAWQATVPLQKSWTQLRD